MILPVRLPCERTTYFASGRGLFGRRLVNTSLSTMRLHQPRSNMSFTFNLEGPVLLSALPGDRFAASTVYVCSLQVTSSLHILSVNICLLKCGQLPSCFDHRFPSPLPLMAIQSSYLRYNHCLRSLCCLLFPVQTRCAAQAYARLGPGLYGINCKALFNIRPTWATQELLLFVRRHRLQTPYLSSTPTSDAYSKLLPSSFALGFGSKLRSTFDDCRVCIRSAFVRWRF